MATSPETAAFFLEQTEGRGLSLRKMFGEYGVFAEGRMVAMICDDALFVRQIAAAGAYLGACAAAPPYPGAKPQWQIEADRWEDADWLAGLLAVMAAALPPPKPKTPPPPKPPRAGAAKAAAGTAAAAKPGSPRNKH